MPLKTKIILCAIRTIGSFAMLAILILGARWLKLGYDDLKIALGFVNAYLPEAILLLGITGGSLVFYRMDQDPESDFSFDKLFRSGSEYDIYRFAFFWLLILAGWVVFVHEWRDKPIESLIGIVLGIFVAKGGVDSIAAALGKPREEKKE